MQYKHGDPCGLAERGVSEPELWKYFARVKLKIFGDPYTLLLVWIRLSACLVGSKHKRKQTEQTEKHTGFEHCHSVSSQAIGLN
jgi:hypothetical protein